MKLKIIHLCFCQVMLRRNEWEIDSNAIVINIVIVNGATNKFRISYFSKCLY